MPPLENPSHRPSFKGSAASRMLGEIEKDLANRKDVNMTRKKMSYQSYQLAKQSKPLK